MTSHSSPVLDVVMYHYVRDLKQSPLPRLKAMELADFRQQVSWLSENYEMATLSSAMAFLKGEYRPKRDLALLTFDDGVKEHYNAVTPILADHKIQGLFFLITGCMEEHRVAPVHMNHVLMASLDWSRYTQGFLQELGLDRIPKVDESLAARTYPWDAPDVAQFKLYFNFGLPGATRDDAVRTLFERYIGPERKFSQDYYVNWDEARSMQTAGMVLGGHSHTHNALAKLNPLELKADLEACRFLLDQKLHQQSLWPFSYPYGKKESFTAETVAKLQQLRFDCSFVTEAGTNSPGTDLFRVRRVDCKVVSQSKMNAA